MSLVAPKTAGVKTINYVVMSVLNRLRDYTMRDYSFLEQIIIEGYSELNLWHLDNIEVVYLRMSEAKTVDLPADYVDYCKIGIPINGKIKVLTNNENILLPRKFEDGTDVGNADETVSGDDGIFFIDHFRNGNFIAGLYGSTGGRDQAYYKIDRETRRIVFSGSVPRGEIVLEYISSGVNLQGSTLIPAEAIPALRAYALWQLIENDRKVPASEKERKKAAYEEEIEALRFFQTSFTADEYKKHVWKSTKQSIKR